MAWTELIARCLGARVSAKTEHGGVTASVAGAANTSNRWHA